jgi:hypothetical protein
MRWAGHVACMREMINAYKILVRTSEWKIPLGRHGSRIENKLMILKKKCKDVDWIQHVQTSPAEDSCE